MILWMLYPKNWTLPAGGAIVGYITNWIALKWIFEPIEPTKIGPFVLQGMFLRRQREVSEDFSVYIAEEVLNSQRVWESMLNNSEERFSSILRRNVPLFGSQILQIVEELRSKVGSSAAHAVHQYTNSKLNLKATLIEKMRKLSPKEFEQVMLHQMFEFRSDYVQVLHPVFQEDELTLIIAGGVLGAIAGLLQWWINVQIERRNRKSD